MAVLLVFVFFTACREFVTDQFPDFDRRPTVNSILVAGKNVQLHLSFAAKLDSNQLETIDNATVALFENNIFKENLAAEGNGIYTSQTIVKALHTYSCTINIPNFDEITCQTTIPAEPSILKINHITSAGIDEEGMAYPALELSFANSPATEQYFQIDMQLIQYEYTTSAQVIKITDKVLLAGGLPILVFDNKLITTDSYTMKINYITGSASTMNGYRKAVLFPLVVELRAVSADYHHFMRQQYVYEQGRYPYVVGGVVLAASMYSNIENGYGIFAGYSSAVADTIYPPQ